MGLMHLHLKKRVVLFLVVSAFLLSTSLAVAGRHSKFVNKLAAEVDAAFEDEDGGEEVHERLLRANTKDYGRYDPAPALVKPPFKLIPN